MEDHLQTQEGWWKQKFDPLEALFTSQLSTPATLFTSQLSTLATPPQPEPDVDDPMKSGLSIALSVEPRDIRPDNNQDEVEALEQLNTTLKELVEIDDSEGLIGSYARKDVDGVWIDNT